MARTFLTVLRRRAREAPPVPASEDVRALLLSLADYYKPNSKGYCIFYPLQGGGLARDKRDPARSGGRVVLRISGHSLNPFHVRSEDKRSLLFISVVVADSDPTAQFREPGDVPENVRELSYPGRATLQQIVDDISAVIVEGLAKKYYKQVNLAPAKV
jgi:hypothetical protein